MSATHQSNRSFHRSDCGSGDGRFAVQNNNPDVEVQMGGPNLGLSWHDSLEGRQFLLKLRSVIQKHSS